MTDKDSESEKIMNKIQNDSCRSEIAGGLIYTHGRANSNTAKLLEVSSFAYAAIELLAEKGLIDIEVLDRKKKEIADRLVEKFRQEGIGAAYQDPEHDKYTFESSVEIDCENRIHLCKAACCRLRFALSHQDVEEGIVQWDFCASLFHCQRRRRLLSPSRSRLHELYDPLKSTRSVSCV